MDRGKTIISQEVIQSFQGKETSQYDRKNNYLEMTVRIQNTETKETLGVMLVSISTDEIRANMKILETKGMTILSIIALLVLVFGYLLAGILMKPFQKVTRSIEDITDGYLDESISVPDYLETELITDAFNKMLTRVRTLDDSRQEFVSNVSHELKTPLASMKVLADSLNGQEGRWNFIRSSCRILPRRLTAKTRLLPTFCRWSRWIKRWQTSISPRSISTSC